LVLLDRKEELELWRQLLFAVQAVGEVDPTDAAICMELDLQCLNVVGPVGAACEIRQVELNLIPTFVQTHRHGTNEGLHARCALEIRGAEAPTNVLVVQDLHLKGEVLLQVLDNHYQEGQLDPKRFLGVPRAGNVAGGNVGAHDLKYRRLDVTVSQPLDVAIAHL